MKLVLSLLALIYFLLPYDLFPDVFLGWGWLDDLVIFYFLWRFFYRGKSLPFGLFQKGSGEAKRPSGQAYGEGDPRNMSVAMGFRLPTDVSRGIPMMCSRFRATHQRKKLEQHTRTLQGNITLTRSFILAKSSNRWQKNASRRYRRHIRN